jgi:predicted lipid-binding transport protein (Tim44 family)
VLGPLLHPGRAVDVRIPPADAPAPPRAPAAEPAAASPEPVAPEAQAPESPSPAADAAPAAEDDDAPLPPVAATDPAAPAAEPPPDTELTVGPPTLAEARMLVQDFRLAYEDRDVDRLMALFARDASENGRGGLSQIAEAYRKAFVDIDDVHYALPDLRLTTRDGRVTARGPFIVTYQNPDGSKGEMRGTATWVIERRDGRPKIVAFDYEMAPTPSRPR